MHNGNGDDITQENALCSARKLSKFGASVEAREPWAWEKGGRWECTERRGRNPRRGQSGMCINCVCGQSW